MILLYIYVHVYCVWSYSTSTTSTIGNHCLGVWRKALAAPVSHRHIFDFSRMRSKGSRFTLGVWGLRVCPIVRNRLQPSATVRNCPQPFAWGPYGRAYGKFCRMGHFWRFQTSRCFVSRGSRGTSWHTDVFCNVSKVVLCGRRNTFATFSQDKLQFKRGRRSTLDVSIVISRGKCSTLDVSCCVFFANRMVRAASSGNKVQIPWQQNWRKPCTKHRFWGGKFRGSQENP